MDRNELIRRLAANEACPHGETELGAFSEAHLTALAGVYLGDAGDGAGDGSEAPAGDPAANAAGTDGADPASNDCGCGSGEGSSNAAPVVEPDPASPASGLTAQQATLLQRLEALGEDGLTMLEALRDNEAADRERIVARLAANELCPLERVDLELLPIVRLAALDTFYNPQAPENWAGAGAFEANLGEPEGYLAQTRMNRETPNGSLFAFDPPAEA